MNTLIAIATVSFAAAGLAGLIRSLPIWSPAAKARKPLGCVFCMGGWCALFIMVLARITGVREPPGAMEALLIWLGSTGGSALILAQSGIFAGDLFAPTP